MVQVENEYGSFACDRNYSRWLRDLTKEYVGNKAEMFTNDGPSQLPCGKIDDVLATLDFGSGMKMDEFPFNEKKMKVIVLFFFFLTTNFIA